MRFASFCYGVFITVIVVNPLERKLAKRTFVHCLKALLRTNFLNDVTAAPFSVSFLKLAAEKKHRKRCSCDVIIDIRT